MRATLIGISALLLGAGAINLGLGLQSSLLGLRAGIEQFSIITTGLVMSSYYAGFVGGSLVAPLIVNRVGHIQTFSAFASLASAAALCHAVFVEPVTWIILRAITGLCFAGLSLVTESWLNERSSNLNRGALLSVYFVTILGATALGQALLAIAPPTGYELFVLVSVIISIAIVPVTLTTKAMPNEIEPERLGLKRLYEISPVGVIGCFGAGLGSGAFWALGAVYAQDIGLSTSDIVLFMILLIGGGMVTQWPLGRLSDLIDRRWVISGISLAMAAVGALIATGTVTQGLWLFVFAGLTGGLLLPLYGISIAHANDYMKMKDFVPASASLLLIYGCGAMGGPIIATMVMSVLGPEGLFVHAAAISAVVCVFALFRMMRRAKAPDADSAKFTVVPRTTAMVFELDRRSEDESKD